MRAEAFMKSTLAPLLGLCLIGAGATVLAGGWAVTTIDHLPDYAVAGTPLRLSFAVRQHGFALHAGLTGDVLATHGTERVRVKTTPAEKDGYYTADLTLPSAGTWTIRITTWGTAQVSMPVVAPGQSAPAISAADRGARLFAAKGCVTCHRNDAASGETLPFSIGPALSGKHYPAEFLSAWLANPRPCGSAQPCMPNLGLTGPEISALSAFLGSVSAPATVAGR